MQWFLAVVLVAILGVAAMAAAGRMGELSREPVRDTYRQDLPQDRALSAADLQALRFGITLRGYAMSQVDDLLDRLTAEIAERDATIERLSAPAVTSAAAVPPASPALSPTSASDGRPDAAGGPVIDLDGPRTHQDQDQQPPVGPRGEETW